MPVKGTFHLVSPGDLTGVSPAAPAEISNLRSDQDSSHHRGPPNKVQHSKPNFILWHPKRKSTQPYQPLVGQNCNSIMNGSYMLCQTVAFISKAPGEGTAIGT